MSLAVSGELPTTPGGWGAVYADPAWGWRTWGAVDKVPHRGAEAPYLPMSKAQLEAMPVGRVAAPHSLLFMWTVSSHVDQAIDLGRAWDFQYRGLGFVWVKTDKAGRPRMSLGRWTRQEAEICLIFGRGRPPRRDGGVRQVLMAPRREHSRKPDQFAYRVQRLVRGPYLELFSRVSRPGWTTWGDETGKFDAQHSTPDTASQRGPEIPAWCSAGGPGALCRCDRCALRRLEIRELIKQLRNGKRPAPT